MSECPFYVGRRLSPALLHFEGKGLDAMGDFMTSVPLGLCPLPGFQLVIL